MYRKLAAAFALSAEDLSAVLSDGKTPAWQNRLQWVRQSLVEDGLLDRAERGVWQLSPTGWEAAGQPSLGAKDSTPPQGYEDPIPNTGLSTSAGEASILVQELRAFGIDSSNPTRLEEACARAFLFLGFDAEVIGGAGNTDVVLTAPLGVNQYLAVLDAKSTAKGQVSGAQVDWLSIKHHRERMKADYGCVVGPGFGGGHLLERAREFGMVLLSIDELAEILELHEASPFSLSELRVLFESTPQARAALPRLRSLARDRMRLQVLTSRALTLIDSFNRVQPDLVVAKPETLQALMLASGDDILKGTTINEVGTVLRLLEAAGVLAPVEGGGFVSLTSMRGAHDRLARLVPDL